MTRSKRTSDFFNHKPINVHLMGVGGRFGKSAPLGIPWEFAAGLARTRLPQIISLVPVLGYAILWSDPLQDILLSFRSLGQLWFEPLTRVKLLYVGSVFVLAGFIVYRLWCPPLMRKFPDHFLFSEFVVTSRSAAIVALIHISLIDRVQGDIKGEEDHPSGNFLGYMGRGALITNLNKCGPDTWTEGAITPEFVATLRPSIGAYFALMSWNNLFASSISAALLTIGCITFFLPSLE